MKRSEKEIKLDEKIGFGCSLKNMFVGVVKPEAYMKNGQSGKTWHAVMVVLGMSIILYLFTFCHITSYLEMEDWPGLWMRR